MADSASHGYFKICPSCGISFWSALGVIVDTDIVQIVAKKLDESRPTDALRKLIRQVTMEG